MVNGRTRRRGYLLTLSLACVALTGCALQWDDVPGAPIRPVAPAEALDAWESDVAGAVAEWGDALGPIGCERPFHMVLRGDDGHRVELVPLADWDNGADVAGMTWGTQDPRIEIRADIDAKHQHRPVLLHELGHALGLGHADRTFGDSVMTSGASTGHLEPRDIAAAACMLGCGACDEVTDPYDA